MVGVHDSEVSDLEAMSTIAPEAWPRRSCLGRTCMKWRDDGELSDRDVQLILRRLVQVDRQAEALLDRIPGWSSLRSPGIG